MSSENVVEASEDQEEVPCNRRESQDSCEASNSDSIFQGANQLYPSRRTAANHEHQNQNQQQKSNSTLDLPANVLQDYAASSSQPSSSRHLHSSSTSSLGEVAALFRNRLPRDDLRRSPNSDKAVNILPVSRNLAEHVSNLIAIGRKPVAVVQKKKPTNTADENPGARPLLGWQADKKTLRERIEHMYCNETLADVYFVVGVDEFRQRIPAHKFVLSIGSVVFDAMFNGGLTPNHPEEALEIELPDVEPSAFLALLKFLYSDEVKIEAESVMTTLYTAKKYAVPAMEKECVRFLEQCLVPDNAFMMLSQAKLFDEPELTQKCLEVIDKNTLEALNGEGFIDIDLDTLCEVLTRDNLRIREIFLFQAVLRWSKFEAERRGLPASVDNRRIVLSRAIQLIRFPLMKMEEFALNVDPQLLSESEMNKIYKYLAVSPPDRPVLVYSDRPRCQISSTEYVVSRFQRIENRWGFNGTSDRIKFMVDRRIFVVGFGLYGAISGPHEYKTQIKIIHCGTNKTLAEHDTSFVCDGNSRPCRVCFKEPVEILPGITYIAAALIRGPDSYYGTKGLRRVSTNDSDVTFQFTYAAMNNNGTSVEDGQIPEMIYYTAAE
ncbi:Protein CBR-TAG-30 [Caenorhabditis briggsae]|uniref:Protein CBR-TAG-30 n=1 Tax=Caenorhabditis briggsae TaxID=6238 RepID=A8X0R1_CAEBR|nr:Protein CBR-TAG-30 [Caenorhabditis briggsae]CAP26221.1 Protein CBR-TAG-30 [Caenorhabditis briggsae]